MPDIFHNTAAVAQFFTDCISVEGLRAFILSASGDAADTARKVSGTYSACVFPNGFADPFAEADADTDVRTFTILIPAGEWLDHTHPQVGDLVTLDSGEQLAVSRIDSLTGDTWSLTAKEVD